MPSTMHLCLVPGTPPHGRLHSPVGMEAIQAKGESSRAWSPALPCPPRLRGQEGHTGPAETGGASVMTETRDHLAPGLPEKCVLWGPSKGPTLQWEKRGGNHRRTCLRTQGRAAYKREDARGVEGKGGS